MPYIQNDMVTLQDKVSEPITSCGCGEGASCADNFIDPDSNNPDIRHDWSVEEIHALFAKPMMDLLFEAQTMHRKYHTPNQVQLSTLLNIKSGGCSEDCKYCAQSSRYAKDTKLKASQLMDTQKVIEKAKRAKEMGSGRFCMGAAWRELKPRDLQQIGDIIEGVKGLGMETCMTLGLLDQKQADYLADKGLDYYNHNLDTSEEYYSEVITTRTYQDRLNTIDAVRKAGMNVCSGGIIGLGEEQKDRAGLLKSLANMPQHPNSVPINMLVPVPGTPMANTKKLSSLEFIRTIAVTRLVIPKAYVRLSAGRKELSSEAQAMAFQAGANSIFYGDTLLTTENPTVAKDMALFKELGISTQQEHQAKHENQACETEQTCQSSHEHQHHKCEDEA